jgi:LmbE family N-acetylglucosaminyl deacetylase
MAVGRVEVSFRERDAQAARALAVRKIFPGRAPNLAFGAGRGSGALHMDKAEGPQRRNPSCMPPTRAPRPEALAAPPSGRVLILASHAEAEVLGCGGTAAMHAEQGDDVRVVVACDGTAGVVGDDVFVRRNEARSGGRRLGLSDYVFLEYPEAREPTADEMAEVIARVAEEVLDYRPDLIYAPWIGEHELDHHVLARATRAAIAVSGHGGQSWGYEVWTPVVATRVVDVSGVWDKKLAAICEHASQLGFADLLHAATGLGAQRSLYLESGARQGEAFVPLLGGFPADRAELDSIARATLRMGGRRSCG